LRLSPTSVAIFLTYNYKNDDGTLVGRTKED